MLNNNIMPTYYNKSIFALLFFILISGSVWGQGPASIKRTTTIAFACNKALPIDLYKASELYISPENGYWGDVHGAPYNGQQSTISTIKERPYTSGNIFNATTADTGTYTFYFYVTSSKGYCDISTSTKITLVINLVRGDCMPPIAGGLRPNYAFCYGTNLEINSQFTYDNFTIEEMLFSKTDEPHKWKIDSTNMNSPWLPLTVYTDTTFKTQIGNNNFLISTKPADKLSLFDTTYYVVVMRPDGNKVRVDMTLTVYPESTLEVLFFPDVKNMFTQMEIDDDVTITVVNDNLFTVYDYFRNNQHLNDYFLGGDRTSSEIRLDALSFSGVEDFIEVIAVDTNRCVTKWSDEVVIKIPFPNSFSPNGDGINDILFGGEKFRNREFYLEVFNRWGNLVYAGASGWDGKYRGQDAPAATYNYVIHLKLANGTERDIRGNVALVRRGL